MSFEISLGVALCVQSAELLLLDQQLKCERSNSDSLYSFFRSKVKTKNVKFLSFFARGPKPPQFQGLPQCGKIILASQLLPPGHFRFFRGHSLRPAGL